MKPSLTHVFEVATAVVKLSGPYGLKNSPKGYSRNFNRDYFRNSSSKVRAISKRSAGKYFGKIFKEIPGYIADRIAAGISKRTLIRFFAGIPEAINQFLKELLKEFSYEY